MGTLDITAQEPWDLSMEGSQLLTTAQGQLAFLAYHPFLRPWHQVYSFSFYKFLKKDSNWILLQVSLLYLWIRMSLPILLVPKSKKCLLPLRCITAAIPTLISKCLLTRLSSIQQGVKLLLLLPHSMLKWQRRPFMKPSLLLLRQGISPHPMVA